MALMQLPTEEDYWKEGKSGAITYIAFKKWMSHGRFRFIKKCLCLSDYSISATAKARDKLQKARDAIIAVRDGAMCEGSEVEACEKRVDSAMWCRLHTWILF
eukprot:9068490-Ditylum_brightwellii.AAC.1